MKFTRPRLIIVLLTVLGIGFFMRLGFWQLSRAEEKTQLLADFDAGTQQSNQPLSRALGQMANTRFARTAMRGRFLLLPSILLDNQRESGQIGVSVFSAFQPYAEPGENPLASPPALLIARGFIAINPNRSAFPNPSVPSGDVYLTGILARPPSSGIRLGDDVLTEVPGKSLLTTRIEPEKIARALRQPLIQYVLQLDAGSPHGFIQHFKPSTFGPEKHRGYALTWFGLALTVLIVFLLLHFQKRARP